ncbi:MAG TPA: NAD(P)/FAD-dependent oxidoreductase [Thermoanaerobaculia bacterium]|nr:NAD(P)/FAD-dependent oxidoreductase [Thermoanaerobaculia bacterium]
MPDEADVVIAGGGPAGLATAIAARRRGLSVLVLDRAAPPIDKPCGEGIMPDGIAALERLGVTASRLGRPFPGIRYVDGERVAEGRFPGAPGRAVRRPVLHAALVERAAEAGVVLRWGETVAGLEEGAFRTRRGAVRGRWLVGADGLRSRVRRWAALEGRARGPRRFGVRRHYRLAPWSAAVEVSWGPGVEAYVTPVGDDEVGVAMLWSGRKASFDELLAAFPALAERLAASPVTSRDQGAGPFLCRPRGVACGRLALVGDAAGYVDALTGEGVGLAVRQGEALAAALAGGTLASWPAQHRRLVRLPATLTRLLLVAEARPWLRRRFVSAMAGEAGLFCRLLGLHAGQLPLRRLGAGGVARLLRGLLRSPGGTAGLESP